MKYLEIFLMNKNYKTSLTEIKEDKINKGYPHGYKDWYSLQDDL